MGHSPIVCPCLHSLPPDEAAIGWLSRPRPSGPQFLHSLSPSLPLPSPVPRGSSKIASANADGSVSLKVCKDPKKKTIKHSKMGLRRAMVLIGIHVLIGLHIAIWLAMGRTISPVEPSEAMQTLETGLVNAGFVFFSLAILSTAIFGRFFCGWGCHVVALQDLCRWMMLKIGIHPRPFRARLLMYAPLALALYMFVWPNFKRFVVFPLFEAAGTPSPAWLKPVPMPMGFESGFIVDDFWATFPTWIVAIPFFLVVGFATVYFLGAKGFCTYGCPYGGFFTPVDRVSPFRIRVTDDCEQCGHCTAVCSSNVRVHEEVRDFGMVVDPGCMKCMDCVSVCPNDALFVGLGAPAVFAKPRSEAAKQTRKQARAKRRRTLDASMGEEIVILAAGLLMFVGFRGMFETIPMLMAVGMAGVGAYGVWMTIRLVRDRNARLHRAQLKRNGRWQPGGVVLALVTLAAVATAAWGTAVHYQRWRADLIFARVQVPSNLALIPGFAPAASDAANATAALAHYARADSPARGGFGWRLTPDELLRVAYLHVVLGDLDAAERAMAEIIDKGSPTANLVMEHAQVMRAMGAGEAQIAAALGDALERHEDLHAVRGLIARRAMASEEGLAVAQGVWDAAPPGVQEDAAYWIARAKFLLEVGAGSRAAAAAGTAAGYLDDGRAHAGGWLDLAEIAVSLADAGKVGANLDRAIAANPRDPALKLRIAGLLLQLERTTEGRVWLATAVEHKHTPIGVLITAAQLHAQLGEIEAAENLVNRAAARADAKPWELVQVGGTLVSFGRGLDRPELVDRGVALVEEAASLKPDSPSLAAQVANLHATLGRMPEAAAAMERAAERATSSATLAQQAADLFERAGNAERAAFWRDEAQRRTDLSPEP